MAEDGKLLPCDQCLKLLSLHRFRNAISRKPPKDENRVYIPYHIQPAKIGKMYGLGFSGLIDGVHPIYKSIPVILCLLFIDLQP
jgi:hypothetical protein